jgi:poly(A) polymerase
MEFLISALGATASQMGAEVYLVGGRIRDFLLNKKTGDFDFAVKGDSSSFAKELAKALEGSYILLDKETKLSRVVLDDGITLDFSPLKGNDIEEDLSNRDFTINAMALPITLLNKDFSFNPSDIIDPLRGQEDLKKGIIKQCSREGFSQDPLRMLRAVRLKSNCGFVVECRTEQNIKQNASLIKNVSGERISQEFFEILGSNQSHDHITYMDQTLGLIEEIFEEVKDMKDVGKCAYHVVDSWQHSVYTLHVIENIIYANGYFEDHVRIEYENHSKQKLSGNRTRMQLMKFAALFHDIGKPSAMKIDETGRVRFRGHEVTGVKIIKDIGQRLKLSRKEIDILSKLVYNHMIPLVLYKKNDLSSESIFKLFKNMQEDTLDLLLVSLSDIISTRQLLHPEEPMGMYKVHIEFLANNYLTRYRQLFDISHIITGEDIKENFSILESHLIGELIERVRYAIFAGEVSNKEDALEYIERYRYR